MDRGFDPVAPIIHDWTYEPMVYDLLAPEGSTYRYHAENNRGAGCHKTLDSTLQLSGEPVHACSVRARYGPMHTRQCSGRETRWKDALERVCRQ